jgi:hypothetical protein
MLPVVKEKDLFGTPFKSVPLNFGASDSKRDTFEWKALQFAPIQESAPEHDGNSASQKAKIPEKN